MSDATSFKICMLGNGKVGKTSVVQQFVNKQFDEDVKRTVGVSFFEKAVEFEDPAGPTRLINLEIWDTAGQEEYRSLAKLYYRGVAAVVLTFDITKKGSFNDGVVFWHEQLLREAGSAKIVLCGNKCDREAEREVSQDLARSFASKNGFCCYVETSAKDDINIEQLFSKLAQCLSEGQEKERTGFVDMTGGEGKPGWCEC